MMQELIIYNFDSKDDLKDWTIVNDGVMGGVSQSSIQLNDEGNAVFRGEISLDNNGGFASVRRRTNINTVQNYKFVNLRVRGRVSTYQFRIKQSVQDSYSYVHKFELTPEWRTVQLPLSAFYPRFRGQNLDLPHFEANVIEEIAFLIGNKKEEHFELEIEKIYLSK